MAEKIASFSMKDLSDKVLQATEDQIDVALEACGVQAVSYAVTHATEQGVVDTGLLRNSITYALGGKTANKRTYHASSGSSKYTTKEGKVKRQSASSVNAGTVKIGRYEGEAPENQPKKRSVFIGTNVEYAVYNELGTTKMKARPFLRPALEQHINEYKTVFERVLAKLGK